MHIDIIILHEQTSNKKYLPWSRTVGFNTFSDKAISMKQVPLAQCNTYGYTEILKLKFVFQFHE